jgi:cytochrome P450
MDMLPMPETTPTLPLSYPFPRGPLGTPPPLLHWARKHRPVCPVTLPSGTPAWMITRKTDISEVFTDRRFSRDLAFTDAPRIIGDDFTSVTGSIFNTDPPEHTRIRQVVAPYYTRAHVERYRPVVTNLITDTLDAMATGPNPTNLLEAFCKPLPPQIACALLRVPPQTRAGFVDNIALQTNFAADPTDLAAATDAIAELIRQVIHTRRDNDDDRDDPIGALITAREESAITEDELHGTASYLMFTGVESLVSPLATGPFTLLLHDNQLKDCQREPGLWPRAVEEVLRYHHNGVLGLPRIAVEDVELHGVTIHRGDAICAAMLGATWDPQHYRNPAKFNIYRAENADPTFGAGPHYCIGANQARMILTIAYHTLFERFPTLELAVPDQEIPWDNQSAFTRPLSLPVTWKTTEP